MTTKKEVTLTVKEEEAIKLAETKAINTPEDMSASVNVLSTLNQTLDRLTEDKEKLTKPINELLKEIRGRYKPFEVKLEEAIATIRKAMILYQTEQKRIAKEEEDKIIDRIGEGKGKFKPETAIRKMEEVDKPDSKVATEAGSVKFKTVAKFEVEDVSLLPKEYLLANEVAVRKAMLEGKKLPGVRYFTEEVPFNTR